MWPVTKPGYRRTATATASADHSTRDPHTPPMTRHKALLPTTTWTARSRLRQAAQTALLACAIAAASAQAGIYTCVDAKGRKLTSDRPIAECMDREQKELNSSGTVKRVVPPAYTADERAQEEAKRKAEAERLTRAADDKRQVRALLARYPNQAAHDKARAAALEQVDAVIALIHKRNDELLKQKQEIDAEMEFYKKDPVKAPAWLKKRGDENNQQLTAQERRQSEQQAEKDRINARFDEELQRLRDLWADQGKR